MKSVSSPSSSSFLRSGFCLAVHFDSADLVTFCFLLQKKENDLFPFQKVFVIDLQKCSFYFVRLQVAAAPNPEGLSGVFVVECTDTADFWRTAQPVKLKSKLLNSNLQASAQHMWANKCASFCI